MGTFNEVVNITTFTTTTCRVCLQNPEHSNSLLDMVHYEDGKQMEIREVLQIVCKTAGTFDCAETSEHSQKPARICEECTEKLLSAYELLRLIERSEQLLSIALFQRDCIEEDQHLDDEIEEINCIDQEHVEDDDDEQSGEANTESENLEVLDEEFQINEEPQIEPCDEQQDNEDYVEEFIVCDLLPEHIKTESDSEQTTNAHIRKKRTTANTRRYEIGSRLTNTENANWHKCEQCKRSFAKSETYEKHLRIAHPPTPLVSIVTDMLTKTDESTSITCPHCPRIFARSDNLRRHLKAMHSQEITYLNGSVDVTAAKTQHKYKRGLCPFCGQSFSQASLAVHIRRHTGENPYKCNNKDCQKAFPRRQDLIIHQRQHTGERPHICTVCGKSFMRPNKLTRHLRIHTGHRPYKCTECDKTFSQSNDLKIHLRRHSGEKPYRCGVCGEGFICGTKLNTHRRLKSHYADEEEQEPIDPYAKCRVVNRNNTPAAILTITEESAEMQLQELKVFY